MAIAPKAAAEAMQRSRPVDAMGDTLPERIISIDSDFSP
jgi:hypothetical protein